MRDRPWSEATRFNHFQVDRITRGAASQTLRLNHILYQCIGTYMTVGTFGYYEPRVLSAGMRLAP